MTNTDEVVTRVREVRHRLTQEDPRGRETTSWTSRLSRFRSSTVTNCAI
jgi:hypothetical protein